MDLSGEHRINAPRETVWQALNDPEILKQCISGCQELDKESDTALTAKVKTKIGPVSATFKGKVSLTDLDPPKGYTISGEGQGGVAGFAKGGARVTLEEDGSATVLRYVADGQVGGKLAQVGARLVEGSARKVADDFFKTFNDLVGTAETPETVETPPQEHAMEAPVMSDDTPVRPHYGPPFEMNFENLWFGFVATALIVLIVLAAAAQ
ncbi:MAG: carbon monoxide dehydrogenase [Rhodospirillaceae bacterium]|nr:carbon monoxide dehydrogenase [Rhodospirillaceae bacterium]|tara:strand:+ start:3363 stop:3989 length:627 start_codon:yes stop_codon:yes gene_type:complete